MLTSGARRVGTGPEGVEGTVGASAGSFRRRPEPKPSFPRGEDGRAAVAGAGSKVRCGWSARGGRFACPGCSAGCRRSSWRVRTAVGPEFGAGVEGGADTKVLSLLRLLSRGFSLRAATDRCGRSRSGRSDNRRASLLESNGTRPLTSPTRFKSRSLARTKSLPETRRRPKSPAPTLVTPLCPFT